MTRATVMLLVAMLFLIPDRLFSQEASPNDSSKLAVERAAQLEVFQGLAADFQVIIGADRIVPLTRQPIYRWSHPVGATIDAAAFAWMDGTQPVVIGSMILRRNEGYYCELQSVTAENIKVIKNGATVWKPQKPGCEFKPIPDAPRPAKTASERMIQMKQLTNRFAAELTKQPPNYPADSIWRLRLLPKQIVRYGNSESATIDGAIFALCHDTDPEVLLLLEARGSEDPYWSYAFAPLTGWQATGSLDDKSVWMKPQVYLATDPAQTYIQFLSLSPSGKKP